MNVVRSEKATDADYWMQQKLDEENAKKNGDAGVVEDDDEKEPGRVCFLVLLRSIHRCVQVFFFSHEGPLSQCDKLLDIIAWPLHMMMKFTVPDCREDKCVPS